MVLVIKLGVKITFLLRACRSKNHQSNKNASNWLQDIRENKFTIQQKYVEYYLFDIYDNNAKKVE